MNNDFMQTYSMQNFKTDNDGKVFYTTFTGEQFVGYSKQAYEELQQIANEALSKAEEIKKEKADAGTAAASNVTLTHGADHKKMVADEGELWKGAHEVAVRAYNEVKSMIMLYKQPNS